MNHQPTPSPTNQEGTILSATLAIASGLLGFIEHADAILGLIAKFVGIVAGMSSIALAYYTYRNKLSKGKDDL